MHRWAVVFCLLARVAHAQDLNSEVDDGSADYSDYKDEGPAQTLRLRDHVFLVPILQQGAFVTTHVGIREGVAIAEVPDLPVGSVGTRDVTLTGFQQSIDLGFRILDWLGIAGFARGIAYTGADAESVVLEGASINVMLDGGLVARLWKNDKLGSQLSLRARAEHTEGHELPLLVLVQSVVDTPVSSVRSVIDGNLRELLFVPTSETAVVGGLHGAQYLNRFLALQLGAIFTYAWKTREPFDPRAGERREDDSTVFRTELAAALELTFDPLHVPLSLQAEYQLTLGSEDNDQTSALDRDIAMSTVAFGVYYVGRPNLQLGISAVSVLSAEPLHGVGRRSEDRLSGEPTLGYGELILRYIW